MGSCESYGLILVTNPSCEIIRVLRLNFVFGVPTISPKRWHHFLKNRTTKRRQKGESNTSESTDDRFFDCEVNVIPAKMEHRVSSTVDGLDGPPQRHLNEFFFFLKRLEVTDKLHKNDLHNQNALELSHHASRFLPGYWMFVDPGSKDTWKHVGKPNGEWATQLSVSSQIHRIWSPSCPRHNPHTTKVERQQPFPREHRGQSAASVAGGAHTK